MQYEFLKHFPRRMKHVGAYALLFANSSQKTIWKQYGFLKLDEQVNVIFALLLYLMEQSLKEESLHGQPEHALLWQEHEL